jgi:aminopeptidase N
VSNTPETKSGATPKRPGWTRHEFAQSKPLPTYLVAMAVGPFDVLDGGTAGQKKTRLRYFTPKGRAAEARYAKEVTPRLLEALEDYFGMAYPFDKLDAVSVPQTVGFGAMENVGMITYASSLIAAPPREETPLFQRRYAAVAAHEMAHMWFGDLVTLAWWDDTWLNEAFATWMSNKVIARYKPEWDSGWSVGYSRGRALELDRLAAARRVRNPVTEKTEIWGAFDGITYNKGAAVLAMFENAFSPEKFREGVRAFLKRHAWANATSMDFIRALGEAAGKEAQALGAFRSFIEQPGVPLIDVALHCTSEGASLDLYQRRLRPLGSSASELEWSTPLCVRYAKSTRCTDMKNGAQTLALPEATSCPAWVLGNAGGRAHYVPRYDGATGEKLRKGAAALSPNEMVSALVDARVLSESGLMSLGEALAWADAGLAHPSPVARVFALDLIGERRDAWLTPLDAAAKRDIVARRLRPLASELGWSEQPGESDDVRELRPHVMRTAALSDEDGRVRAQARELASAWLGNHDAVPATLTSAVLITAARFGDAELFERLVGVLTTTQDLRERDYVREAIAKARDGKLRARALGLTLQSELNGRDALELLLEELDDAANRRPALEFLRANYDALVTKLPEDSMATVMRVVGEICTPEERELFTGMFKERAAKYLDGPRQYRQSLERMDLCIAAHGTP